MEWTTQTGIRADNGEPYSETYPTFNVPTGNTSGPYGVCSICRLEFPLTELRKIGGGLYCERWGHAEDKLVDIRKARGR